MKVENRPGSDERQVLIGMIVSPVVAGKVASRWSKEGLFASRWANLIGGWCVKYFFKYGTAPAAQIETIFGSWASSGQRDKATVQLVDKFLSGLSDEHERLASELNPDYVVDLAGKHFQTVALSKLAEDVRGDLELNDLDRAQARVAGFGKIELGEGAGINVLEDEEAIRAVFEEESESLIEWPGDLAKFFGTAFERDAFISFLGAEKSGKTWWLMEVAWRAMLQKKRVAFFEVGDMSEKQIMKRMMVRAAKHPFKPQTVLKPTSISVDQETHEVAVEHDEIQFYDPLTWAKAARACERIVKGRNHPYLKLSCHPNSAVGMDGIRSILQGWQRDEWVPDVVVIDYADNLEPPVGANDFRHGTNLIWKQMRRASQELHCCLVTATQANAAAYDRSVLGKGNFSEDKRKLAHVTGMIGINSTKEERDKNVTRLNWIVRREAEFSEFRCIAIAHCLALSRPFVLSAF